MLSDLIRKLFIILFLCASIVSLLYFTDLKDLFKVEEKVEEFKKETKEKIEEKKEEIKKEVEKVEEKVNSNIEEVKEKVEDLKKLKLKDIIK